MHSAETQQPSVERMPPDRMVCMEVWGGNRPVHRAFQLAGLKAWIYSRPYEGAAARGDVYFLSSCASGRITRLYVIASPGNSDAPQRTPGDNAISASRLAKSASQITSSSVPLKLPRR